ncbi:MAG TPA: hypothetical protein VFE32_04120 [Puia sp.]|jgi:hypothetical protein|nr:hypothetical protein [Puia sp.]
MGYFIRVLGIYEDAVPLDELNAALKQEGLAASIEADHHEDPWSVLEVATKSGLKLTQIEKNFVFPGCLAQAELDEFRLLIREHQPLSAVQWLDNYLDRIKVTYAFRILDGAMLDDNFEVVNALRRTIWGKSGGLLQHDLEGFSNDEGYHILWQFPDDITGDKYCAVLDNGVWVRFRMDLGDPFQRMAFWAGEVPQMAVRLK